MLRRRLPSCCGDSSKRWNAKAAATRLATSRRPSTRRIRTCVSRNAASMATVCEPPALGSEGSLTYWGIGHSHLVANQRIGLQSGRFNGGHDRAEDIGGFQLFKEGV